MTPAQKAATIEWIKERVETCHRVRGNTPHHWPGFAVGLMQAAHLVQRQITGTDEASICPGNPPGTIAEYLGILKRELGIQPPLQALANLNRELVQLTAVHQEAA